MNTPVKAGLALAVIAGLWAGGTAYSGQRVKTEMILQAEGWRANTQSPIRVTGVSYQKGFTSATRTLELEFGCTPDQGGKAEPVKMTWRDTIQHGPLPGFAGFGAARIDSELVLSDAQRAELKKATGMDSLPISLRTQVGFGGNTDSTVTMPAFTLQPDPNTKLSFKGLDARLQMAKDGSARFEGKLPGYEIESPQAGFKMVIADAQFEGEGLAPLWWATSGKGKGSIKTMSFQAPGPEGQPRTLFALRDLTVSQDGRVSDNLYSAEAQMQGKGEIAGQALDSFSMKYGMKRLNTAIYAEFVRSFWSQGCQTAGSNAKAQAEKMMEPLLQLLPHNPQFSLDEFKFTLAGRTAEFTYSVGTQGVTAADLKAPNLAPVLMNKAQFKMTAKVPLGLVEQIAKAAGKELPPEMLEAQVAQGVERGMIKREGEVVSAEVELSAGSLKLNGKPMPFPGLTPPPQPAQVPQQQ